MLLKRVVFISALVFAEIASASEIYDYARPISAYGMGGVYIPFVEDADAPTWNPAQLAVVGEATWKIANLGLGANGADLYQTYVDVQNSGCSGSACFDEYFGKPIRFGYFGDTSLVFPYWGITAYTGLKIEGVLHNPALPEFNMTYFSDYGFVTGLGFPILPMISGGASIKRINRSGGSQDVSLTALTSGASLLDDFTARGTAYGLDLALMWRTPGEVPIKMSTVLLWQDVGSTAFITDPSATSAPDRIRDNLTLGLGMVMDLPGLDWKAGMEYRQITLTGEQLGKKLHFGTELGLPLIDVRAGLNQGYPTLGLGMDFFLFRFDVASYTEEVGAYPGQTPSQRLDLSLSFSVSVDADFSLTAKDGKKRKLKQRR